MSLTVSEISSPDEYVAWDAFVAQHADGSFAQLSGWANLKQQFEWQSHILVVRAGNKVVAGALMMDRILLGKRLSYVPYGPLVDAAADEAWPLLLDGLIRESRNSVVLRLEPHAASDEGEGVRMKEMLEQQGFKPVEKFLQPEATLLLDLNQSEDELLAGMRQTTRRYIRQAERAGLEVVVDTTGDRLGDFYMALQQVNQRRQFGVHTLEYYTKAWEALGGGKLAQPYLLMVQKGEEVLGSYFVVRVGDKSWELYGGVNEAGMKLKANYLLKWQSILQMKRNGVTIYDQWGVAPLQEVGGNYDKQHHLAGVTYFKEGFGGRRITYVGGYDKVNQSLIYNLARVVRKL